MTRALRNPTLALLAFGAAVCVLGLGSVPLFDLDEGAFAQATMEMLHSGNFAATTLNGEPRYDKPILIYWLQAASVTAFGPSEWAFRLPSALATALWAWALYGFARQQTDTPTARTATWLMLGSLGVSIIAKAAIADALLNLFLCLSMLDIYRHYRNPSQGLRLRIFVWFGLGFLTKGPVALVIPILASAGFYLSLRQVRPWLRAAFDPLGWTVLLLVVTPWLVAVYHAQGWGFFAGFFGEHNLGRFAHTREGHGGSPLYYVVALPLVLLPFSSWLVVTLRRSRQLWAEPLDRFLLLWFAVVFVLVSASATQLPHYVLYGATPLFLLMARQRDSLRSTALAVAPPLAFLALLATLPLVARQLGNFGLRPYEAAMLDSAPQIFSAGYAAAAAGALLLAGALAWRYRTTPSQALMGIAVVQFALVHLFVVPAVAALQQSPVRMAGLKARTSDSPTVMHGINTPSFSVYAGKTTPRREPHAGEWALTRVDRVDELCAAHRCRTVFARGGIVLLDIES